MNCLTDVELITNYELRIAFGIEAEMGACQFVAFGLLRDGL
jgi:hypothetical protein